MKNLINWGMFYSGNYRDSGEGGLFVYAVWGDVKTECVVDAMAHLDYNNIVDASGPLADDVREWEREASRVRYPDPYPTYEAEAIMLFAQTGESLYSEYRGEYAKITVADLTEEGLELIGKLNELYGSEATFITYLDT